jgi:hypothetical protein
VTIADEVDASIEGLSRVRTDAVRARLDTRRYLKAFLLHHGLRSTGEISSAEAPE